MLFTTVCLLNDLQRCVVFKIILIFYTILSFDYAKRITANFEDFIKKIEFLKYIIGNTCPLPEDAFQSYPAEASPDRLNFDGFSDNLCEENHTCQVDPSAHRIYK